MSDHGTPRHPADEGGLAPSSGTPEPVDLGSDRRSRRVWAVLLAGPVIWMAYFGVVYLTAEAGCTGDGALLEALDPPVPVVVTWVATAVAVVACVASAAWARRWWHADRETPAAVSDGDLRGTQLSFAGFVLSIGSLLAVVITAAPVLVLSCTG